MKRWIVIDSQSCCHPAVVMLELELHQKLLQSCLNAAFQFQTIGRSTGIKWKIHMFHGIKPLTWSHTILLAKNNNFYSHEGTFAWRRPYLGTQSPTHSQRNWLIWVIGSTCVRGRATVSEWVTEWFVRSELSFTAGRERGGWTEVRKQSRCFSHLANTAMNLI